MPRITAYAVCTAKPVSVPIQASLSSVCFLNTEPEKSSTEETKYSTMEAKKTMFMSVFNETYLPVNIISIIQVSGVNLKRIHIFCADLWNCVSCRTN